MEERGPAHLEARHGLTHDLLRVLPHVLVAPLAVAEADHGVDLGEHDAEHAGIEQRVEAELGVIAHDDAIELRADVDRIGLERGAHVFERERLHHLDEAPLLGGDGRELDARPSRDRRCPGRKKQRERWRASRAFGRLRTAEGSRSLA